MGKISKVNRIFLVLLVVTVYFSYYSYTLASHAESVATEIAALPPLGTEQLTLDKLHETDKNFTVELTLLGASPTSDNINELKAYYEEVTTHYICQSSKFEDTFEEGYNINVEIQYQNESSEAFHRIHIVKDHCLNS